MPDHPAIAHALTEALKLRQPPIAVCLRVADSLPDGVSARRDIAAGGNPTIQKSLARLRGPSAST